MEFIENQYENFEREEENNEEPAENVSSIKIPKRIFQTHKSVKYVQSNPELVNAINSWRRFVPEFGYHFYTDEMCDEFMKNEMTNEFGEEIYQVYNMLPMAVMKADLWRYCIIYKYGGIYADVDTICKIDPNTFTKYDTMLVCAPEKINSYLCQWIFAAPMSSPILKKVIELVIERVLTTEIKGEHIIHYLTGPGVFSDGVENYLKESNHPTYKNRQKYFLYKDPTMICFQSEFFHNNMIKHLYTGENGWKKERYSVLVV